MDSTGQYKSLRKIIKPLLSLFLILLLFFSSCYPQKKAIDKYLIDIEIDKENVKRISEIEEELLKLEIDNQQDLEKYKFIVETRLLTILEKSVKDLSSFKIRSNKLIEIHSILIKSRKLTIKSFRLYISDLDTETFEAHQKQLKENLKKVEELEQIYYRRLNHHLLEYNYEKN